MIKFLEMQVICQIEAFDYTCTKLQLTKFYTYDSCQTSMSKVTAELIDYYCISAS